MTGGSCELRVADEHDGETRVAALRLDLPDGPLQVAGRAEGRVAASGALKLSEINYDWVLARAQGYVGGEAFAGAARATCDLETTGSLWRVVAFDRSIRRASARKTGGRGGLPRRRLRDGQRRRAVASTPRVDGVDAAGGWRRRRGWIASTPRVDRVDAAGQSRRRRGLIASTPVDRTDATG